MAANAHTIRNLLTLLVPDTTAAGIGNTLATIDIARNPRINQGNIFAMLKFAFSSLPFLLFASEAAMSNHIICRVRFCRAVLGEAGPLPAAAAG